MKVIMSVTLMVPITSKHPAVSVGGQYQLMPVGEPAGPCGGLINDSDTMTNETMMQFVCNMT